MATGIERDARELAMTPVPDPYRSQLLDPYAGQPVPEEATLLAGSGLPQVSPSRRRTDVHVPNPRIPAPISAKLAGVLGIVLGTAVGILGLILIAIVSFLNKYGAPDRSFYQGSDGSYLTIASVDFVLACGCISGAIMLLLGRIAGRVLLTTSGWPVLGLSVYWLLTDGINPLLPIVLGLTAGGMLMTLYHPAVTRWLGVLPAPQPQ
jgi:hypothetical protein